VDTRHSAAIFDVERGTVIVKDPIDYAENPTVTGDNWAKLADLADRPNITVAEFDAVFREHLRESPVTTLDNVMTVLSSVGTDQDRQAAADDVRAFEDLLDGAARHLAVSYGMQRGLTALDIGATHTARTRLAGLSSVTGRLGAQAALLAAVVEFFNSRQRDGAAHEYFSQPATLGSRRFEEAIRRAYRCDPGYTDEWIRLLDERKRLTVNEHGKRDLSRVINRLLVELPRPETLEDSTRLAVLLSRTAVGAARLARELEQAAEELDDGGESYAAVFAKLGLVLEDLLLAEFGGGSRAGAHELLEILIGQGRRRSDDEEG
jgi:hypothetical protein